MHSRSSSPSFDFKAFESKFQSSSRRDTPSRKPFVAITLMCWNLQFPFLADLHAQTALIPTSNNFAHSSLISEWLLAWIFGAPELLASLLDHASRVNCSRATFTHLGGRCRRSFFNNLLCCCVAWDWLHLFTKRSTTSE